MHEIFSRPGLRKRECTTLKASCYHCLRYKNSKKSTKLVRDSRRRSEEVETLLYGGSTDVAQRLDPGVGAVSAAAVSTLEQHRAHVLFTQRTVDRVWNRLACL